MSVCSGMLKVLNEYLDGRLNGVEMQSVSAHLKSCPGCNLEMKRLSRTLALLSALGSEKVPADLLPRIQTAVAQERARRNESIFEAWERAWQQMIGDFALQLAGGFASAVLLIGSVALMVGMFVQPIQVRADDEPLGMRSDPRLLYVSSQATPNQLDQINDLSVEVAVNERGQAYDYRIVSGPDDEATRRQIENMLLYSTFEPARYYGKSVLGLAIVTFNGIDVKG